MKKTGDERDGLNRREFLSTAAGVAAVSLTQPDQVAAKTAVDTKAAAPTEAELAMEFDEPSGYSTEEIDNYFVKRPGSDFMVDVIRSLGFEYITTNPGSSFRGIQESIVNYGGNTKAIRNPNYLPARTRSRLSRWVTAMRRSRPSRLPCWRMAQSASSMPPWPYTTPGAIVPRW
jgi:hypothetical protein